MIFAPADSLLSSRWKKEKRRAPESVSDTTRAFHYSNETPCRQKHGTGNLKRKDSTQPRNYFSPKKGSSKKRQSRFTASVIKIHLFGKNISALFGHIGARGRP